MKKMKRAALLLSALLLLFVFAPFVPADFGDYAGDSDYGYDSYDSYDSYDYDDDDDDGGWLFGGSDSSGGSGSSGGGKSAYYSFGDYPTEDVYYGAMLLADSLGRIIQTNTLSTEALETPGEADSGAGVVGLALLLGTAAIVAVVILRVRSGGGPGFGGGSSRKKRAGTKAGTPVAPGAEPTPQSALRNISEYYRFDPDFSEAELYEKISNWYVKFQNAWQDRNLEELRPYLTDAFYAQMDRQLDAYRQKKQTPHVERIAVLGTSLSGWQRRGGEDILVARLRTRIVDYVTDDATGRIVRGSNTAEKFMEYEWTLTRRTGVKTVTGEGARVQNCPNCGGAININRTARCPYCDSIVTVDSSDWAVSAIKGISQRTRG